MSDQINRFVNRGVDLAFRNAFDPLSHFCRPPKHLAAVGVVERFPSETGFQAAALRRRDEKQFILAQCPAKQDFGCVPFLRGKVAGLDKETFFQGKLQFQGTGIDSTRNGGFCCNGKNTNARNSRISVYLIEHRHRSSSMTASIRLSPGVSSRYQSR